MIYNDHMAGAYPTRAPRAMDASLVSEVSALEVSTMGTAAPTIIRSR